MVCSQYQKRKADCLPSDLSMGFCKPPDSLEGTLKQGLKAFENSQETLAIGSDRLTHAIKPWLTKRAVDDAANGHSADKVQVVKLFRLMNKIRR